MPLSPGTRLGHYDLTALIGDGGMGDTRKVLPTAAGWPIRKMSWAHQRQRRVPDIGMARFEIDDAMTAPATEGTTGDTGSVARKAPALPIRYSSPDVVRPSSAASLPKTVASCRSRSPIRWCWCCTSFSSIAFTLRYWTVSGRPASS